MAIRCIRVFYSISSRIDDVTTCMNLGVLNSFKLQSKWRVKLTVQRKNVDKYDRTYKHKYRIQCYTYERMY